MVISLYATETFSVNGSAMKSEAGLALLKLDPQAQASPGA